MFSHGWAFGVADCAQRRSGSVPKMSKTYDLIVIGGGSAGLVAAGGSAILGAKVALIEKTALGGDCLYSGCVPSKTLIRSARFAHDAKHSEKYGFKPLKPKFRDDSFASITARVQSVIKTIEQHDAPEVFEKMGVEVIFGSPEFLNPNEIEVVLNESGAKRKMKAKRFCISTGSRPFIPPIDGLRETGFITNEEVFHLTELPEDLIVLGGGPIGIELGQAFARFGSDVKVVEMGDDILSKEDREVSRLIKRVLAAEGVQFLMNYETKNAKKNAEGKKVLTIGDDERNFEIEADEILVAVGRRPNLEGLKLENAGVKYDERRIETQENLQTSQKHIYAAGDVTGHFQFTHMADHEAQIVIQNAFVPFPFKKSTDFRVVPWTTFTSPEVGRVGMTYLEACENFDSGVKAYKVLFEENDRAQAENATEGFAKIVTHNSQIVGATLVCEHAGELIHEFVWAVKRRMKITNLNEIIRVYPTLAKITQAVATEATLEKLKSPLVQKWFGRYLKFWRWF